MLVTSRAAIAVADGVYPCFTLLAYVGMVGIGVDHHAPELANVASYADIQRVFSGSARL